MKELFLIFTILLFSFNIFADDLTESEVIIIDEPEPTIEYVFTDVNINKLSNFIDLKNSLNSAKEVLTRCSVNIGNAKKDVQEKYSKVEDQLTVEMKNKFEVYLPASENIKKAIDQLLISLEEEWDNY